MDPVQPVQVGDIMIAVIAGALVVLMGALYAVLFAFGRLWRKRSLLNLSYLSFGLLAASVLILARALNLTGLWQIVTATLLLGYLLAPRAIWRLSVGTHGILDHDDSPDSAAAFPEERIMSNTPWWASESFWRKSAIWVTAGMFVILILLTFDTVSQIRAGTARVPAYDVINQRIYYRFDKARNLPAPVIGEDAPLFGKKLTPQEAEDLVALGKMTFQSKNCINCHTMLGNGAYYAPDLTKAWLDPAWAGESAREGLMVKFLVDPETNARGYGMSRRMPKLGITEAEARGLVAFLKWTAAIDTNGFPRNFQPIAQEGDL